MALPDVSPAEQRTVQPGNRQEWLFSFHMPRILFTPIHQLFIHLLFMEDQADSHFLFDQQHFCLSQDKQFINYVK